MKYFYSEINKEKYDEYGAPLFDNEKIINRLKQLKTMRVSLVIITDGRGELLEQTLFSLSNMVKYPFIEKLIINDCVDEGFKKELNNLANFHGLTVIQHEEKKGFAGAYNTAWKSVSEKADYVFSTEDDFLFNEEIEIGKMISILQYNRNLVQCSLKRQAWSENEKASGGFVEQWPELYEQKQFADIFWTEHRVFYSNNPNLTPKWVIDKGWPLLPKSEGEFSIILFNNPNYKSCLYGKKFEVPKVNHIGGLRVGFNY